MTHSPYPIIADILSTYQKAVKLFNGDGIKAHEWMFTRTEYLFNRSPVEICLQGNGQTLLKDLAEKLGEAAGKTDS